MPFETLDPALGENNFVKFIVHISKSYASKMQFKGVFSKDDFIVNFFPL